MSLELVLSSLLWLGVLSSNSYERSDITQVNRCGDEDKAEVMDVQIKASWCESGQILVWVAISI